MSGVCVKVTNLKKSFNGNNILNGVSFECKENESVVVLGESGTGKSVMMRIIGMLMNATSGSVKIEKQEIVGITEKNKERMMKNIGFLFQSSALFENLPVWENIVFYKLFNLKMEKDELKNRAIYIAKTLNIPESVMDLSPSEISGGLQRRVALARTIEKDPGLILLDEPTTGLDPLVCESVSSAINRTKSYTGATMITITHDLNFALEIGDKIIVLREGKVIWEGKPSEIFNCDNEYIKDYIKAANIKKHKNLI